MTSSPSEPAPATEAAPVPHPLQDFADTVADATGGSVTVAFDTVKVTVEPSRWVEALTTARDQLDLVFFSWLSAVDWTNEVAVGDELSEKVDERFEVLATVSDLGEGKRVTFSTSIDKPEATLPTLVEVYAGANWHEREAAEMFGIRFDGHPDLSHLYLPDGFIGNPLRKSFPLLSREVKPWPGTVDVESMPESVSTENPEA